MVSFKFAQLMSIVVLTCACMDIEARFITRTSDYSDLAPREVPDNKPTKPAPGLPAGGTETPELSEASKAKFIEGIKAKAGAGGVSKAGPLTAPTGVNVTKRAETPSPSPAPGKVTGGKPSTTDLTKTKTTPVSPGEIPKNGESTNQKTTPNHSHKHKGKQTVPVVFTLWKWHGCAHRWTHVVSLGFAIRISQTTLTTTVRNWQDATTSMASPIGGGKATSGNTKSHSRSLQPPSPIEDAKTTSSVKPASVKTKRAKNGGAPSGKMMASPTGGGKSTSGKSKSHSRSLKPRTPIENTKSSSSVKPVSGMTKRTDNLIKNIQKKPPRQQKKLPRQQKKLSRFPPKETKPISPQETNPTAKETKPISPKETTPTAKEGKPISPKETKPTSPKESESKESKPTEKKPKKESKTKESSESKPIENKPPSKDKDNTESKKDSKPTEKKNKEGDTKESKSKVSDDKKEDAEGSKKAGLKDKVGKLFNTLGL
ncbi:hypothetical protein PSHT_00671 [Puccinia striiformis]|uniref:Uncharacterized protein n=1 Tax=Puccinia striiformis TaxID=27350 RepID=A0A2S4WMJ0_9BASI|nr:hypothetical protein PSHT_00671 [Puccinia striiformis]